MGQWIVCSIRRLVRPRALKKNCWLKGANAAGAAAFLLGYAYLFVPTNVVGLYCKRADWTQGLRLGAECMCITDKTYTSVAYVRSNEDIASDAKCAMTIKPIGRLGNLMGQYATLYSLARLNRRPAVIFPEMNVLKRHFLQLSLPTIHKSVASHTPWTEYLIHDWMEDSYNDFEGNFVKLIGYPSSWTFFHKVRQELRWEFTFRPALALDVHRFLSRIRGKRKTATFVGVHVRRGDYVRLMRDVYDGVLADARYLKQAMQYYRQRFPQALFVVSSDDMAWCRANVDFTRGDTFLAWHGNARDPVRDMALLSHCNHSIITVGTFGFWSAYLAGGEVVYLSNFTKPKSSFNSLFRQDAFYLPQWKGIPANLSLLDSNN